MSGQHKSLIFNEKETMSEKSIRFFSSYKKQLFYVAFSLFFLFLVLLGRALVVAAPPFFKIKKDMQRFQQESLSQGYSPEIFDRLQKDFKPYPSLRNKYEGSISQILTSSGMGKEKKNFLQTGLQKLKGSTLLPYQRFSEIALIIEQKDWQQALHKTQAFDQEFHNHSDPYLKPLIFLNSLYSAALLEQLSLDHQHSWERVKVLSEILEKDELSRFFFFDKIQNIFHEGEFSYQKFLQLYS